MTEPSTYDVELTVRFFEADRAGVAFFGRIFEYAHAAEEELLATCGCDIRTNFDERGWGLPIRHAESDYRRRLKLGEHLCVAVSVHQLGSSSITFQFDIYGQGDREAAGKEATSRITVHLTQVCVALDGASGNFTTRPLPPELLDGLRRLGMLAHLEGGQPKGSGISK